MTVRLKEACAKCGRTMTDAEIGDYWYDKRAEPGFKCLCKRCARSHYFGQAGVLMRRARRRGGVAHPALR